MYEKLLQEGKIGSVILRNRMVMPAMGSSHGNFDGTVNQGLIDYYTKRATGYFGLVITEFTCIDKLGQAIPGQLMICDDSYIEGLKKLTESVHNENGKIFCQLHHAGRETNSAVTGMQPVAPSPIPCPINREIPRELSTFEVYELIEKYGDAAVRAQKAGFDGVEIHGAHGYMPAQFLSGYSNKRNDEFGGDFSGRVYFGEKLIENIKKKCGKDFPVCFRISGDERVCGGRKIDETVLICKRLENAGVDAIHVSTGVYATMPYMVPPYNVSVGFNLYAAEAVKKAVTIPVIAVGRINEPDLGENAIRSGIADFIALGRASIADPEFPKKVLENRISEISPCVGCLTRCNGTPGITQGDYGVSCMLNPFSGHESSLKMTKAEKIKNIVVVGAGPAGLEAAWILAARGHKVTVLEKNKVAGGQFIAAAIPPDKHELSRGIKYYLTMCKKYDVNIQYDTNADKKTIDSFAPDAVIIATGATPLNLSIQNDGIKVVNAIDLLLGKVYMGENLLIVGGGMVGLEVASHVISQNRKASIVEMLSEVGKDLNPSIKYFLMDSLLKSCVKIYTDTKVEKFTLNGAICSTQKGELDLSGYDMIVLAIGSISNNSLKDELNNSSYELFVIGDANKPRKAVEAIEEALRLALKL